MSNDKPSEPTIRAVPLYPGEGWSSSRRIGPYKLLQRIGEGGMGEVWMAEQEQPIRRRVAVKLIKTGADSRQVVARFEAERQALAMMNHENIAKVLDAGATDAGTPFVVMELVQGIPFTSYCDKQKLAIHERLELFVPVCEAVQHAHQKGIIHRDLKPSNVLIGLYDGKPVPKVIDFGLAKAMGQQARLTDKTMFTEFGQVVGTVQYMSPEQAEMNQLDVDTRSDIYSLGVMLYELLTGSTPLDAESLKEQTILEILESIRSKDPPRPSIRLSSISHEAASGVSTQRRIEIGKLKSFLSGELDWIVMKALEKDRTRRYGSASDFAADLERFLAGDVVTARPPSASYRMRKYVAKNRGLVASATIIAALLMTALMGVSWFAVDANRSKVKVSKTAAERLQALEALEETNKKLEKTNAERTALVMQGSQLALQRGIEAWHAGLPDDAIAHWTTSVQMHSENDDAKYWLDHALLSHRQHGWNPPYWIVGGDAETAKAVLSQHGKYVALQSASDNTVTLVDVISKQKVNTPNAVIGVIDDLYWEDSQRFRLLTVEVASKQATVWSIDGEKCSQLSIIQGDIEEGELEFSPGGNFLVRQLDGDQHTLAYRVSSGEKFEFDPATPGQIFFLAVDDTAAVAKTESGYIARSTADSSFVDYRELRMPDFGTGAMPTATSLPAPVTAPVTAPATEPAYDDAATQEASIRPMPAFADRNNGETETESHIEPSVLVSTFVQDLPGPETSQQNAIPVGFRQSARNRAMLTGQRLEEQVPGSAFIALSPFSYGEWTQLLLSGFDLETGATELRLLDLQAPAQTFLPGSTSPSRLFVQDLKNVLAITQIDNAGGCGVGVKCNKSRFRVDLIWNDTRYQHIKSPGDDVFDAVIDSLRPRVLLLSRPLPNPQIQLYDLSSPLLEPTEISVPNTSTPASRLESYFVGRGGDVVCRFARNAVGIWDTGRGSPTHAQLSSLNDEARIGNNYRYETAEPGDVTKILDLNGDARDVTTFRGLGTLPADGELNVSPLPHCIVRNGRSELVLSRIASTTTGQREVVFLDAESLTPNLSTVLEQAPEQIDWFDFDPSGRYMVVQGSRSETAVQTKEVQRQNDNDAASGNSILEAQLQSIPSFSILDTENMVWVLGATDGSFSAFHPTRAELMWINSEELVSFDLQQSTMSSVLSGVIAACISPEGGRLSVVDQDGNLLTYGADRGELSPLGPPLHLQIAEFASVFLAMGYNQSGEKLWIEYSGYTSYYANSPGCTDCSSDPEATKTTAKELRHVLVVNPEAQTIERNLNSLGISSSILLRETTYGAMAGSADYEKFSLGPIPFGGVAFDGDYVMTVIEEDQGDATSLAHRVEVWNVRTGRPEATSVLLGPPGRNSEPELAIAVLPEAFRVFLVREDGKLAYFDMPKRESRSLLDYTDSATQQMLIALAGKQVTEHGQVVDVLLAERISTLSSKQDLMAFQPGHGEGTVTSNNSIGVQSSWHYSSHARAGADPVEVPKEDAADHAGISRVLTLYPEVQKMRFETGFEYDDGLILKVANESKWLQLSKRRRLIFELDTRSATREVIELQDKKRELQIQIPARGGDAMMKGKLQKEYQLWRNVSVVAAR